MVTARDSLDGVRLPGGGDTRGGSALLAVFHLRAGREFALVDGIHDDGARLLLSCFLHDGDGEGLILAGRWVVRLRAGHVAVHDARALLSRLVPVLLHSRRIAGSRLSFFLS